MNVEIASGLVVVMLSLWFLLGSSSSLSPDMTSIMGLNGCCEENVAVKSASSTTSRLGRSSMCSERCTGKWIASSCSSSWNSVTNRFWNQWPCAGATSSASGGAAGTRGGCFFSLFSFCVCVAGPCKKSSSESRLSCVMTGISIWDKSQLWDSLSSEEPLETSPEMKQDRHF